MPCAGAGRLRRRRACSHAFGVPAEMLFLRESARLYSWLWLLRADGGLSVWRLPRQVHGDDRLLPALARPDERDDPARGWRRLPYAPVVPVPRWSVSWGHPWAGKCRRLPRCSRSPCSIPWARWSRRGIPRLCRELQSLGDLARARAHAPVAGTGVVPADGGAAPAGLSPSARKFWTTMVTRSVATGHGFQRRCWMPSTADGT
jgi:hypothetical protein